MSESFPAAPTDEDGVRKSVVTAESGASAAGGNGFRTTRASPKPESLPDPSTWHHRVRVVLHSAEQLFVQKPDWAKFFGQILGPDGLIHQNFPNSQELATFRRSDEHAQIQAMLDQLRQEKEDPNQANEPLRMITVRLPKSLHEALKMEADERGTSMNKLCITKLLQILDHHQKSQR